MKKLFEEFKTFINRGVETKFGNAQSGSKGGTMLKADKKY